MCILCGYNIILLCGYKGPGDYPSTLSGLFKIMMIINVCSIIVLCGYKGPGDYQAIQDTGDGDDNGDGDIGLGITQ